MLSKFISLVILLCFILPSFVNAETAENDFVEKAAAVEWVIANASKPIKPSLAKSIVDHVYYQANKFQIDPMLILGMMRTESGFNPKALSREGARGLLQVLPKYHRKELQGRNAYLPEVSIEVGVGILNDCMVQGKGNLLKATSCYVGGKDKHYYNTIVAYRKDLLEFTVKSILMA